MLMLLGSIVMGNECITAFTITDNERFFWKKNLSSGLFTHYSAVQQL